MRRDDEDDDDDDEPRARSSSRSRALKTCPDCGGRVSKRATNCPHCGRSTPGFSVGRVLVLLLLVLIAWAVFMLRR